MAINAKEKGKRGERDFCLFLKSMGVSARRSVQYCGANADADIISDDIFYWEIKLRQNLNVYEAIDQIEKDSHGSEKIPALAWRKNHKDWLIIFRGKDFAKLRWEIVSDLEAKEGPVV